MHRDCFYLVTFETKIAFSVILIKKGPKKWFAVKPSNVIMSNHVINMSVNLKQKTESCYGRCKWHPLGSQTNYTEIIFLSKSQWSLTCVEYVLLFCKFHDVKTETSMSFKELFDKQCQLFKLPEILMYSFVGTL